ncbi:RAMP superfamily CRISPR-associated protein [Spirulina major]|uniref:RAMP superfamily CRISPR-associated protein n=1 Tax=Spirulina major TaxID=270636 RepID=UPI0009350723|nr:RAMP superfamily CRISPR-associated protein [Spirulina major]
MPEPSPWLNPNNLPNPDPAASFVEYLRWMRALDSLDHGDRYKNETKTQILHEATNKADYHKRLKKLCDRTQLIAGSGNTFEVSCPWRIRVGGHRGPESMLLPAFDALGMPYIPSATLRGVARNQAIREKLAKVSEWERVKTATKEENERDYLRAKDLWAKADRAVAPYFGHLNPNDDPKNRENSMGAVTFLDAYPLPSKAGGLAMDMANAIWKWDGDQLKYEPNPNTFLSLEKPTFLIGFRPSSIGCDSEKLEKVKNWLIDGLSSGIGSQVNSGYGQLLKPNQKPKKPPFLSVDFSIEGQLIHGYQAFTGWKINNKGNLEMRGKANAEVRPIAFKSMLRYWFRTFALGVLPTNDVQTLEAEIFGGIQPKAKHGYLQVNIVNKEDVQKAFRSNKKSDQTQSNQNKCGKQEGILKLSLSTAIPETKRAVVESLAKHLTWLMFNLGGVGQGARRPKHERTSNPRYRGSTFTSFEMNTNDEFSKSPKTIEKFEQNFKKALRELYACLGTLSSTIIDSRNLQSMPDVSEKQWLNAVDRDCYIVLVSGESKTNKPYALDELHSETHNPQKSVKKYNQQLCGYTGQTSEPSPVWIANFKDYQVVTVFGAVKVKGGNVRLRYLKQLKVNSEKFIKIFPFDKKSN